MRTVSVRANRIAVATTIDSDALCAFSALYRTFEANS